MQKWAASIGYALYFTPLGVATIASEIALANAQPAWTFDGKPNAGVPYDPADWANLALYDQELVWDSEDVFNAVLISGSSSSLDVPVRGDAYDNDPASPTQWGGPFGYKPLPETTELATTDTQALIMAQGRLQQVAGLAESLQIPAVCNPAAEASDTVRVIRPELGIDTIHMLDHFPVPLFGGVQNIDTRIRRVIATT
jgi:hypothetical protein